MGASSFAGDDVEASFPNALVRKINLYEDVNFLVGAVNDNELPETIAIDGVEYTRVNFGEDEISYLKTEAIENLYILSYTELSRSQMECTFMFILSTPKSLRQKRKHRQKLMN